MGQTASTGNLNNVITEVKIAGNVCDFDYLQLDQSMSTHHRFLLRIDFKPDRPSLWAETPEKIFEWLGEKISIKMTHRESGAVTEFYGNITDINLGGEDGNEGYAVIKGGSPTLLLDRDPSMQAFVDYSLRSLVTEVIEQSGVKIELSNKPKFESVIPYTVRYKESSWAFLSRTLRSFGEWFYYDGTKLVVGQPLQTPEMKAVYDVALKRVSISSRIQAINRENVDYNYEKNTRYNDAPLSVIEGENMYMRLAKRKSAPFYPKTQIMPTTHPIINDTDAVNTMNACHSRNYSQMSIHEAKSDTCAIRLGEWVVMTVPESFKGVTQTDLGRIRVIEITHIVGSNGEYYNTFKGVAGGTEAMPNDPNIVQPTAFPEVATVMDNQDPKHLGRVKVQFKWQDGTNESDTTNWVRVQSPDAGSSDVVKTNRGFVFIPEVGDQVMVGYELGDPCRPFVMGSVFHYGNAGGAAENNKIKTITTRSGSTLTFDDDAHTILLCTSKANKIFIDEANGAINIESAEDVNVTTKNVTINASENMTVTVGKDFNMTVGGNSDVSIKGSSTVAIETDSSTRITGNADNQIAGTYEQNVSKAIKIHSDTDTDIEADGAMIVASQKKMNIKSKVKVDIAKE